MPRTIFPRASSTLPKTPPHGPRRPRRSAACVARGARPRRRLTRTVRDTHPWKKAAAREYRSPCAATIHTNAAAPIYQSDASRHTHTCQGETGAPPTHYHSIFTTCRAPGHIVDELYPRCPWAPRAHTLVCQSATTVHRLGHVAPNIAAENGLDRRTRHRYVSLHSLAVIRSSQPTHVHIQGIMVQETHETLRIVTDGSMKCMCTRLTQQASQNATPCSAWTCRWTTGTWAATSMEIKFDTHYPRESHESTRPGKRRKSKRPPPCSGLGTLSHPWSQS